MKKYKAGDIVKVVRKPKQKIDWGNSWTFEMDKFIGEKSIVIYIDRISGYDNVALMKYKDYLKFPDYSHISRSYVFPIASLSDFRKEKLERLISD